MAVNAPPGTGSYGFVDVVERPSMTLSNSGHEELPDLVRADRRGRLLVRAEQRTAILAAFGAGSFDPAPILRTLFDESFSG
ncbi:MAG: hypothetical protein EON58_10655 [Alphaproteobacteria bacterium]|nr:MAG: hypothetical protein EON58_10655 [Alphaproteobacteria bacterium]